jgi:hypothetical protein
MGRVTDQLVELHIDTPCKLGLGRPVLTSPVKPTDIELSCETESVVLNLARCPRIYQPQKGLRFRYSDLAYLFEAIQELQVVGGAGRVWRRITVAGVPHWRQVIYYESFLASPEWVGRPWDWPDTYLPVPDPIYDLDPTTQDVSWVCLTPLASVTV